MNLAKFKPSSENRRILRKGKGISVELVPRDKFDYTPEQRQFFKTYADIKFGKDVMTFERLDALFASPIISHLLVFTDAETGKEVGAATLYLEGKALAFYYYAFYDLNYYARNLGMFMMTSAVALFAERGVKHLYLGTCYSQTALYKTQFAGAEFFNGFRWSDDLDELKFIIKRDKKELTSTCWKPRNTATSSTRATSDKITDASAFRVKVKSKPHRANPAGVLLKIHQVADQSEHVRLAAGKTEAAHFHQQSAMHPAADRANRSRLWNALKVIHRIASVNTGAGKQA